MSSVPPATLPGLLLRNAQEAPAAVAARIRRFGLWKQYTWAELAARTAAVASGLGALGVGPGVSVAIVSAGRPAWLLGDLAVQGLGGASVLVHPGAPPRELGAALVASGAEVVIAEDEEQLDKALEVRATCARLRRVVVADVRGFEMTDPGVSSLAALEATASPDAARAFAATVAALDPSGPACTVAGATYSHAQLLDLARPQLDVVRLVAGDELLSLTSLTDLTEHSLSVVGALSARAVVSFGGGPASVAGDLRSIQPTVLYGPQAMWELVAAEVERRAGDATPLKQRLYRSARRAGARTERSVLWSLLVDRPLRQKLGVSRLRVGLTSTPLTDTSAGFYASLHVPVTVALTVGAAASPPEPVEVHR